MPVVHVFASTGVFRSPEALSAYINQRYNDDGDTVESAFMREVRLTAYEPMSIESVCAEASTSLRELLLGASYAEKWLALVPSNIEATEAICVFEPNVVADPPGCRMQYHGAFRYSA